MSSIHPPAVAARGDEPQAAAATAAAAAPAATWSPDAEDLVDRLAIRVAHVAVGNFRATQALAGEAWGRYQDVQATARKEGNPDAPEVDSALAFVDLVHQ